MNLKVQTPDEWLAAVAKPGFETVSRIVMLPKDWLVVCAGFEERASAVLASAISKQKPFNVLLVHYEPVFRENRSDTIREMIQHADINVSEVIYNRQEPSGFGSTMLEKLSACRGRIFVDVSN